ncbi:hypothetical protein HN51_000942 [Arachis hypogaea]|uniref:RING-type domain-containing protein n=1 Tax=Arachis hypogaea TaxID=3818 RepID=A0A445ETU2_ARAHY|nr:RING-H2 finger protein ATL52-like [Arachis hypogaea]QHO48954.1 RING-H2 finger protein [Arachis hypogaea]RYR78899.1 hypothetical protein Ahy_A01g003763 [Arachis hypogaea]
MADGDDDGGGGFLFNSNVSSVLAGMGSAVIVLLIYRCMSMFLCIRHPLTTEQEQARSPPAGTQSSTLNSVAHMIPSHKYDKKDDDCTTCAVCLGEFEEGDELRRMPECMHSFHVPCIDMWLRSHSTCPICRAHATPSSNHHFNHTTIDMDFMQRILLQGGHAPVPM